MDKKRDARKERDGASAVSPKSADATESNHSKRVGRKAKSVTKGMTPAEQRQRFIEAAREAGCSEDEADFDAALIKIAKPKPKPAS